MLYKGFIYYREMQCDIRAKVRWKQVGNSNKENQNQNELDFEIIRNQSYQKEIRKGLKQRW